MSAYLVDREHVIYLAKAAATETLSWYNNGPHRLHPNSNAQQIADVAQMLWNENRRSIERRYPDTKHNLNNVPGPIDETYQITGDDVRSYYWPRYTPVQVIKSIRCYRYQSCEHEGWETSEAHSFARALTARYISLLPGYEQTIWGAPKPQITGRLAMVERILK